MRLLLLADIHIGSIKDIGYFYNATTNIIEKEVIYNNTDMVIILGDYFDKLFKDNDDYTSLAINIMSFLVRACMRHYTKIRIIYGTESHEVGQYQLFNYFKTSKDIDFKVIDTVMEEKINDVSILYLPEEYIDNKIDHYRKYLYGKKKYNFIFGHGIIEEGMPSIVSYSSTNSSNPEKQVPHFKTQELSNVSDICVFGHYHVYTDIGNNVYYLGSLFRDSFGEEDPKGYGIIDIVDGKYQLSFIENKEAYIYKTYELNISEEYSDPNKLMKKIQSIKKENKDLFDGKLQGQIKLKFKTDREVDPTFKENLKTLISNDKIIKSSIKEMSTSQTSIEMDENDEDDEFNFILDPSLNIVDKIYQAMQIKYDDHMSLDELSSYLEKSMNIINSRYEIKEIEE